MQILGYGEDAITLWALQNRLHDILQTLDDPSDPSGCCAFLRPSFGRRSDRSEFGEFDFILLTDGCVYLAESKWDKSSEKIVTGVLTLRREQLLRHEMLKFYIEEWAFGSYSTWSEFANTAESKLSERAIAKSIPPETSLLAINLQVVLGVIKRRYITHPTIKNILLYLHRGVRVSQHPVTAGRDFLVVPIDYSAGLVDNFIDITS